MPNIGSDVAFYSRLPDCLAFSLFISFFQFYFSHCPFLLLSYLTVLTSFFLTFLSLLLFVRLFKLIAHLSRPIARFSYSDRDTLG